MGALSCLIVFLERLSIALVSDCEGIPEVLVGPLICVLHCP